MVEDEFIGVIVRSSDTTNFVFPFINPLPQLNEFPGFTFGYILTMLPLLERDLSMYLSDFATQVFFERNPTFICH